MADKEAKPADDATGDRKEKVFLYITSGIKAEVAAIAKANGVAFAEQLRWCLMKGLRSEQEQMRKSKGNLPED